MKRILSALLVIVMLFSVMVFPVSASSKEITVYLDAVKIAFDVKPQIINGRTMVPIRAIFEKMGASVDWDANTRTAICKKGNKVVTMTVDSRDMYIDGQVTKMDVSPVVIGGRTLAPARYVAEAFDANVQWSAKNQMVVICSKDVYAYADYPDIPDLGKCYNTPVVNDTVENGRRMISYLYSDLSNEEYYSYLYDNSALVLGNYKEEVLSYENGVLLFGYTKPNETEPRYYIGRMDAEDGSMAFVVLIEEQIAEKSVTLYANDGRTIDVAESEVSAYLQVGWYRTREETQQTLYANDGRTLTVYKSQVPAQLKVGWYLTKEETQQVLYARDGRTITVFKAEVPAYKKVGWYETWDAAMAANKTTSSSSGSENQTADGYYYRTPTGTKYHLDPNCGGKNSYRTTNIAGLSPCKKCVG